MDYSVFNYSTSYLGNLMLDYSVWSFLYIVWRVFLNLGKLFIPDVNCLKYLTYSTEQLSGL